MLPKHLLIHFLVMVSVVFSAVNRPFPQELDFPGCIKPGNISQDKMNQSVSDIFDFYKATYVKKAKNTPGGYYTDASGNGAGGKDAVTVSEAHGYGMIIFALMAGYDSDAQTIFDGYFKFYKDHPSKINATCMSWVVDGSESKKAATSASDGDMDIAYALLLAHYQWGSNGKINYLTEAKNLINKGIKMGDMHQENFRVALGDWNQKSYNKNTDVYATRSSDWMPDHMRAYAAATGDKFWLTASSTIYSLISSITDNYSPNTGLMPDFITKDNPAPDPQGGGTGEKNASNYSYNGCRYPWRIATDYAHYGTPEAKKALDKVSSWLKTSSGESVNKIRAGYTLDGTKLVNYTQLVFTAPFTAGLITDASNQAFLNKCWAEIQSNHGANEYDLAINLLSMLLVSGNWWAPQELTYTVPTAITIDNNQIASSLASGTLISTINTKDGLAPFTYTLTTGLNDFKIKGDSLLTNREFDAQSDNPLSLQIKVTDNNGNSFTQKFQISVTDAGDNMVQHLQWWTDMDSYGSIIDTGSTLINDSSLAVTFTTAKSDKGKFVHGTLSCNEFEEDLGNSAFITIEYRSNNAYNLTLPMQSVKDFAYHSALLPVTNNKWSTITFAVDENTFFQPRDWGTPVPFNASKIKRLSFDTQFEEEAGHLEIRTLLIDGFSKNDGSIVLTQSKTNNKSGIALMGIRGRNISLSIPQAGQYEISLFNLQGRMIYKATKDINAGVATIPINANVGSKMLILRIEHEGVIFSSKIVQQERFKL